MCIKKLIELDDYLKYEIESFKGTIASAQVKELPKWEIYANGVVDAYTLIRAMLHVKFLPDRVEDGEVLTVWIVASIRKSKGKDFENVIVDV